MGLRLCLCTVKIKASACTSAVMGKKTERLCYFLLILHFLKYNNLRFSVEVITLLSDTVKKITSKSLYLGNNKIA
jgi:hypothetical protein